MNAIRENVRRLLNELPQHVRLEAAAKTRSPEEIREAVDAGIRIVGENYVQEAARVSETLGRIADLHLIGRLQRNKAKKAVDLFEIIETVDSFALAREINRHAAAAGKIQKILIEINSGREPQKAGVLPEEAETLAGQVAQLKNVRNVGLMTMGPFLEDPEKLRPCFRETRRLFERLRSMAIPGVDMDVLSMGMSDSYRVAVEEGANLVRIGTRIFGSRPPT